jgi:hypothetical protein
MAVGLFCAQPQKNDMLADGKIRTYKIFHESPFEGEHETMFRFVLLPYGSAYGDIPKNAGHGDKIRFINGDEATIMAVTVCDIETKLTRILALMRYGADIDLIYRAWVKRAVATGAKRAAVNDKQCLFLWHSKKVN